MDDEQLQPAEIGSDRAVEYRRQARHHLTQARIAVGLARQYVEALPDTGLADVAVNLTITNDQLRAHHARLEDR